MLLMWQQWDTVHYYEFDLSINKFEMDSIWKAIWDNTMMSFNWQYDLCLLTQEPRCGETLWMSYLAPGVSSTTQSATQTQVKRIHIFCYTASLMPVYILTEYLAISWILVSVHIIRLMIDHTVVLYGSALNCHSYASLSSLF